jgi:hypothetical protein
MTSEYRTESMPIRRLDAAGARPRTPPREADGSHLDTLRIKSYIQIVAWR